MKRGAKTAKAHAALRREVALANRIIERFGLSRAFGHASARIPGTDTFLINPRYAGVLADPEDVCTVSAEGKRGTNAKITAATMASTAPTRSRLLSTVKSRARMEKREA